MQKNKSYQQLSEATGITVSYLHDIENGRKYPKTDKILALGKALGVDYDYLVSLTGDKRIQPLIDLLSSDFINVIPWEHFGIAPASLLELFTNTPDKITAFISTLVKISRTYHLTKDNFYTTALRSYQDMHNNYFEDLETAARELREAQGWEDLASLDGSVMEQLLAREYHISTDRKKMGTLPQLAHLRSYYSKQKQTLYLNKQLSPGQEAFLIARELGFQHLKLALRPYETIVQHPSSFDLLLNNFRASYFAAALLIPEAAITADIKQLCSATRWEPQGWLDLLDRYRVSPEMLWQRLTNILPHHFNIDQLFFLRMSGTEEQGYEITKELHLSQLHNPHANLSNEHYCRRWLAVSLMQQLSASREKKRSKQILADAQISHYWQTQNRYLCLTIAKPKSRNSEEMVSVTIGMLLDSKLMKLVHFLDDPRLPTRTVHTTCERCSISDCLERAEQPVFVMQAEQEQQTQIALQSLDK